MEVPKGGGQVQLDIVEKAEKMSPCFIDFGSANRATIFRSPVDGGVGINANHERARIFASKDDRSHLLPRLLLLMIRSLGVRGMCR